MGGSIIIDKKNHCIWSAGTQAFLPITDLTRRRFTPSEEQAFAETYAPLEEGFTFIALDDLSKSDFCVFYCRCNAAYLGSQQNEPSYQLSPQFRDGILKLWSELLEQMRTDPRFDPALCAE